MLTLRDANPVNVVCPFCRGPIADGIPASRCFLCRTPHHIDCWVAHGYRCAVFQCSGNQTIVLTEAASGNKWLSRFLVLGELALLLAFLFFVIFVKPGEVLFIFPLRIVILTLGALVLTRAALAIRRRRHTTSNSR